MSRKGYSQDNAACEGFFRRLKTELFYPHDWKAITIDQFAREVNAYIRWYNEKRIKISLGSLSPIESIKQSTFFSTPPPGFTISSTHLLWSKAALSVAHLHKLLIEKPPHRH